MTNDDLLSRHGLRCTTTRVPAWLFACLITFNLAWAAPLEKLVTNELVVGTGVENHAGHFVIIHYDAWVYDDSKPDAKGHLFDSSRQRGKTFTFVYGLKRAVPGMEKGMEGMRVGGKRLIMAPAKLGFDDLRYPYPSDVPRGAALIFEVELLDVVPRGAPAPLNED